MASRTWRPKRTMRRLTTAPRRAPNVTRFQGSEVREEERGTYRAAHGDVPISSTSEPWQTTRADDISTLRKRRQPTQHAETPQQERRRGRHHDAPEKLALADKGRQDPRSYLKVERAVRQTPECCRDQRDLESTEGRTVENTEKTLMDFDGKEQRMPQNGSRDQESREVPSRKKFKIQVTSVSLPHGHGDERVHRVCPDLP